MNLENDTTEDREEQPLELGQVKVIVDVLLGALAARAKHPKDVYGSFLCAGLQHGFRTEGYEATLGLFHAVVEHQRAKHVPNDVDPPFLTE